jgi:hypothetical protein
MPNNTGLFRHRRSLKWAAKKQAIIDDENEKKANTISDYNTIKSNNQTENSVLSTIYRWVKRNL